MPFGLWIAVIFGLSSIPDAKPPGGGIPFADKIAHAGEYGILGALWARARGRGSAAALAAGGAVLGAALGALDETYQSTVPGRQVAAADAVADTIGAAAGAWLVGRRRRGAPARR